MLPSELHKFFWEYDAETLDEKDNWHQVIERLLEYGDIEANRWVYRTYESKQIVKVVKTSRQLSKRTAALWKNLLGIQEESRV